MLGLTTQLALYGDSNAQNAAIDEATGQADARVMRELQLDLSTKRVKSWPDANLVKGKDYEVDEEPYDFHRSQYQQLGFLRLHKRPVQSIQRVRIMLGPHNTVIQYPDVWLRLNKIPGHLSIVPTPGAGWQGVVLQTGQYFLPYLSMGWVGENVPQIIAVDYTTGLGGAADQDDDTFDPLFADLRKQRARLAAREILLDLSNSLAPGIGSKSTSADGLAQSVSYARSGGQTLFGAQIAQIDKDWETFKVAFRESHMGVMFTVV